MSAISIEAYGQFLQLADTLHFARSARALHMSPSALTRCIQRLEEALGEPLFVRDKRQVTLTRAGQLFREHARAQLAAHQALLENLAAEQQAPTGEVRIACTVTACHSILPRLLAASRSRYPGLHLQLSTSDAARCLQRLQADEVDMAVLPMPDEPDPGLHHVALAHTELSFIAPRADPALQRRIVEARWDGMPVILPRRGLERQRVEAWLEARGAQPEVYAEVDGNEAILAMVSLGCGVGVVPELVRTGSPLEGAIVRMDVAEPPAGFDVSLSAKPRTLQRRGARALWALAQTGG